MKMEEFHDGEIMYNVTAVPADAAPETVEGGQYFIAADILQTYIVPIIIITGFFGNCVCFLVFIASPLKRISTSVYLAALAFSDTGFLVCLGIGWLESLGIQFFHKEGICQITVYCSFVFSFTSIWFVNAFTTEMYIAVFHPQKSPKLCLPKNARKIVGSLSIVACLIYVYAFWIAKVVRRDGSGNMVCRIIQEDAKTAMILSVIDTILTLVIPFTMILFMITRLFVHISKFYKTEFESAAQSTVSDTNTDNPEGHQGDSQTSCTVNPSTRQANEAYTKLTRMLVVTVVVFLVLNLPSHAIKVQFLFRSFLSETVRFTPTEGFIQIVFQILYYSNFSVNFLLYSACGRSFRHAMMRLSVNFQRGFCQRIADWRKNIRKMAKRGNNAGDSLEPQSEANGQQHSRLVDIHLNEIRFSQLPSIESQFVCKSPPCLLVCESDNLIEEEKDNPATD